MVRHYLNVDSLATNVFPLSSRYFWKVYARGICAALCTNSTRDFTDDINNSLLLLFFSQIKIYSVSSIPQGIRCLSHSSQIEGDIYVRQKKPLSNALFTLTNGGSNLFFTSVCSIYLLFFRHFVVVYAGVFTFSSPPKRLKKTCFSSQRQFRIK